MSKKIKPLTKLEAKLVWACREITEDMKYIDEFTEQERKLVLKDMKKLAPILERAIKHQEMLVTHRD